MLLSATAIAQPSLPGRVLRAIDGDTLVLDVRGGRFEVDLDGIDAPESNQPWGDAATASLQRALVGAFVVVDVQPGSRGQPVRGSIDFKGRDVALDLLHDGLAWSTVGVDTSGRQNDRDARGSTAGGEPAGDAEHPYTLAERDAREARRGLWSDPLAIPPWQWRRYGGVRR